MGKSNTEKLNCVLETERTFFRKLTLDDVDNVLQIFQDEQAMRYSPVEKIQGEDAARGFVCWNMENYEQYGYGAWAVVSKASGEYVGQAGIVPQASAAEIFYAIVPKFWGQGLATEVALASLNYALQECGLPEVIAIIHPENEPAIHVAQKIGMQESGALEYWGRQNRLFRKSAQSA
jgi:RimJ/RimL family protein N-acetyltransferase